MTGCKMMAVVSLWALMLTGCAGTARWTEGTPEALRPY